MTDDSARRPAAPDGPFRIAFVPGVTPGKWSRIWEQRHPRGRLDVAPIDDADQLAVLHDGRAHMSFVRLPIDRTGLKLIPLYYETPVVVVAKDHPVAAYDEIPVADLADEHLLQDPDAVPEWRDIASEIAEGTRYAVPEISLKEAIETVAAGVGIVIVPKSVARLYNRKDVVHRPVLGVTESQIGLAWLENATDPRIEAFIGIVRGRTERSSRASDPVDTEPAQAKKSGPPKRQSPKAAGGKPVRRGGNRPPSGRRRGR